MKKIIAVALAFGGIVYAEAQSNGKGNGQAKAKKGTPQASTKSKVGNGQGQGQVNSTKPKPDPAARAQKITKVMDSIVTLTPEQETKVSDIQKRRVEEMQAIKTKYNGDMKAAMPELKTARQKYQAEMDAVLTPEQKTKWDAYKQTKKQEMQKKREDMQKGKPANTPPAKPTDEEIETIENLDLED